MIPAQWSESSSPPSEPPQRFPASCWRNCAGPTLTGHPNHTWSSSWSSWWWRLCMMTTMILAMMTTMKMPESRWPPGAMASPGARQGPATAAAIPCQPGIVCKKSSLIKAWKNLLKQWLILCLWPWLSFLQSHKVALRDCREGSKCKDLFVFCLCVHWHVYSVECTL